MLDPKKLASRESNGIFESNPDAYARYADWRASFVGALRELAQKNAYLSSHDTFALRDILFEHAEDRERSFNTVMSDMLQNGTTWYHLLALMLIAGFETNPFPHHAGQYALLISDWIVWREDLLEKAR